MKVHGLAKGRLRIFSSELKVLAAERHSRLSSPKDPSARDEVETSAEVALLGRAGSLALDVNI